MTKATTMPNLKRVLPGFHLLLPEYVGGTERGWLKPGAIIDISDPFVAFATSGQRHKLVDADEDDEPTPYSIKMLENARQAWLKAHKPELAEPEKPAPAKPKGARGIPAPDARPTKSAGVAA